MDAVPTAGTLPCKGEYYAYESRFYRFLVYIT